MEIDLTPEFPSAYEALFQYQWRYIVYYGGRGGGKSWAIADALLIQGAQATLRILCARELQISITDSVHRLLCDRIEALGLQSFYTITQKSIMGANGTIFLFKGIRHNSTEIKSTEGIDVCWVEEAEKVSRNSWEVLIPTIRKEGSRIIVSFNTKNVTDATYERFILQKREDTYVQKVSWRDNPFFPEVLNKERLDMMKRDPEAYAHIWEGEPDTRYSGGVYAIQMARAVADGRVVKGRPIAGLKEGVCTTEGLYDPELPVMTAWDLGRKDSTAIWWWQKAGMEIRLIDYYENSLKDNIDHYIEQIYGCKIITKAINPVNGMVTSWARGEPLPEAKHRMHWKYGKHYVPHDAANKLLAAGGRSIVQQAFALGVKMWVVASTSQQNGIEAARRTIDSSWFDEVRCAYGIRCLMNYHFPYDENKQRFLDVPVHDWSSDCCFVGYTNVLTRNGTCQIMNLPQRGEILTSCGWKQYKNPRITRKNAQLVEVVFKGGYTVLCTPDHLFMTDIGWKCASSLTQTTVIQSTSMKLRNISTGNYTGYGLIMNIYHAAEAVCIDMFGRMPLEKFLQSVTSTIKMATQEIIGWKISNALMPRSTLSLAISIIPKSMEKGNLMNSPEKKPPLGIVPQKGVYGTKDMLSARKDGGYGKENAGIALIVKRNLRQLLKKAVNLKNIVAPHAKPLCIESVRRLDSSEDVWCLTVPDVGNFCLSNGAIVHNCDAYEIIGQVWRNDVQEKEPEKPKFLVNATANEIFWPEKTKIRQERI